MTEELHRGEALSAFGRRDVMTAMLPYLAVRVVARFTSTPISGWMWVPDTTVLLVFMLALLWPWIRIPWTCKHKFRNGREIYFKILK
jgi:hypothetical protein